MIFTFDTLSKSPSCAIQEIKQETQDWDANIVWDKAGCYIMWVDLRKAVFHTQS